MLSWLSRWNKVKLNLHWKWIEHTGRGGSSISGAENFELTLPSTYSPIAAVCPFNFKAADTKMAFISPQLNLRCLGENLTCTAFFHISPPRCGTERKEDPFIHNQRRPRWRIVFWNSITAAENLPLNPIKPLPLALSYDGTSTLHERTRAARFLSARRSQTECAQSLTS